VLTGFIPEKSGWPYGFSNPPGPLLNASWFNLSEPPAATQSSPAGLEEESSTPGSPSL
jgi:hypothetical protein